MANITQGSSPGRPLISIDFDCEAIDSFISMIDSIHGYCVSIKRDDSWTTVIVGCVCEHYPMSDDLESPECLECWEWVENDTNHDNKGLLMYVPLEKIERIYIH